MKSIAIWCLILFLIVVGKSNAQKDEKVIYAVRVDPSSAPKIDGKLDDECWKTAGKAEDFIQFEPVLGEKPKEPTIVYLLYDKERLYVGFECFKNNVNQILGSQTRRDSEFFHDDFVEVFLDTYHDRRNCYSFAVNCIGAQADRRIANEGSMGGGGPMEDRSKEWDCSWEAKTAKTDKGWTAEIAIPFSELRFDRKGSGIWGINFWRSNEEFDESDTWADVGDRRLCVSRFGRLEGLMVKDLAVTRKLELKPYTTVKPHINPKRKIEPDAGIDIRYPSSTITADFTFNPDFGQIEADPERVNFRDIEERLPEKRPFFQEGMELFQTPLELFYTRRVGITELMYGAKAVGKLGGFNLALADCQSNDVKEGDDTTKDETKNNYLVLRTQTDIGSKSSIGIIGINKQKAKGYNRAGGIDCNITLPKDMRLIGQFTKSWSPYKSDNASILSLKRRTRGWDFEIQAVDIGRDFDVESGYIPRIDRRGGKVSAGYEYRRDAKIFKEVSSEIHYERLENHDGIKTNESRRFEIRMNIADFFIMAGPEWYQHTDDFDINIVYTNKMMFLFTGFFPPKWISIRSPLMIGRLENKRTIFTGPGLTIMPLQKLRLEVNVDRFDVEGDPLVLNRRFSAGYQISQKSAIRGTLELTREGKRYMFALFSWEFRPESNLFLVYTDNKEEGNLERMIFFKLAYLFSLGIGRKTSE